MSNAKLLNDLYHSAKIFEAENVSKLVNELTMNGVSYKAQNIVLQLAYNKACTEDAINTIKALLSMEQVPTLETL